MAAVVLHAVQLVGMGVTTTSQCNCMTKQHHLQELVNWREKNPAYGRHRISRPMRIVGPIQFWSVCVIYLEEKEKKK